MLKRNLSLISVCLLAVLLASSSCKSAPTVTTTTGTTPAATGAATTTTTTTSQTSSTAPTTSTTTSTAPVSDPTTPTSQPVTTTSSIPATTITTSTTPPTTSSQPPSSTTTTAPVTPFPCALIDYPDNIWPTYQLKPGDNNFWLQVFYPADFSYPDVTFYYGLQYLSTASKEDIIKFYYDKVQVHHLNAYDDVQGNIGNWEVHARLETAFSSGWVVSLMVGNNKIIYPDNPYYKDYPTALLPLFPNSTPMEDVFNCYTNSVTFTSRYRAAGSLDDVLAHYRTSMAGATGFSETPGSVTVLKGVMGGYEVEVRVSSVNGTFTVKLEKARK